MKILLILFFSLLLNTSLASADEKPGRFFEDQPDVTDEHQIHFIYLLPSDGEDRELDINGSMESILEKVNNTMFEATKANKGSGGVGKKYRYDYRKDGKLDITFIRTSKNWKELQSKTAELMTYFSTHVGQYPYKQYSVIQGGDGGMEYGLSTLITGNRSFGSLVGVTAHEFAHSVQQMTMGAARPPVEFLTAPWFPNWYWEGQANFSQNAAIWFDSFDKYMSQRRQVSGGLFNASIYDSKYIESYFVLNPNKEWGAKHERYRQYDLGAMFIEILTALKGPAATMQLIDRVAEGDTYDQAFEKTYGIKWVDAVPIISRTILKEYKS